MKRSLIVLVNVFFTLAILLFVTQYTKTEADRIKQRQTEAFESMTAAMEKVTTNYLVGEQRVCDSWASIINENRPTMEQVLDFLRYAVTAPGVMAQIIYTDDAAMPGLSTQPKANDPEDFSVSYKNIELFGDDGDPSDKTINITRAYTNPVNSAQSIALYNPVTLLNGRKALVMRVVPISVFEDEWVFPTEEYSAAEIAMIDTAGNYIIKGKSFKNTNFFEFYKSYNDSDFTRQQSF